MLIMRRLVEQAELEDKIAATDVSFNRNTDIAWMHFECLPEILTSLYWVVKSDGSRCARRPPDMLLLDEPTNHLDAESVACQNATLRNMVVLSSCHSRSLFLIMYKDLKSITEEGA